MKSLPYILIALLAIALTLALTRSCSNDGIPPDTTTEVKVEYDTICITDTLYIKEPTAIDTKPLGSIYATLPIKHNGNANKNANDETEGEETDEHNDEPPDSVEVMVPIEQRHYSGENFDLWISGYNPAVDSLNIYPTSKMVTKTITQTTTATKTKRWGLSVGVGVVATPTKVEPGLFIGATYTFLAF